MKKFSVDFGTLIVSNDSAEAEQLLCMSKVVLENIRHLEKSYPNFQYWFESQVVRGILGGSRSFVIELRDGKMAGVAILKDTPEEKKICTISVCDEFKSKGMGVRLFEKSMRLLDTDKPLASVSESRLPEFEKIFEYLDYDYSAEYHGLYLPQRKEFSFNGLLQ
ncbi:hypothetical protein [Gallionella capsiferriformans]|jgi:hypothetical protein|uniref:N-acetyltransferase domain-containing protein n=1 Tax=Gallionella capsiferriformans (strain ES-2) TaxID=395494 RepID=D9SEF4_GALCS|nr:hypothetical protein [Gallionella capsiferriformans]ADL54930.1 hypothetical protein Galf_0898 [Gallionella capsiferriformans ES-2]MDP1594039.1 hypothetical protein [Gallionella sp.]MDP1940379.1 hypothetical protein [Gallionella sp.]